jgi:phosphoglycolate phosphatase-like HAD superfamily hydrolase
MIVLLDIDNTLIDFNECARQTIIKIFNDFNLPYSDNVFETFDAPIVYAKSIDGLTFKNNTIIQNNDFKPFHWNKHRFLFERAINVKIKNNEFSNGFDEQKDVKYNM